MKKIMTWMLILAVGVFTIGCGDGDKKKDDKKGKKTDVKKKDDKKDDKKDEKK